MRRWALAAVVMMVGCVARPVKDTEPPPATSAHEPGPAARESAAEPDAGPTVGASDEVDFSDEAAGPTSSIDAQPKRRPSGSFDLCGDKCKDNIELADSLDDEGDEGDEGDDE